MEDNKIISNFTVWGPHLELSEKSTCLVFTKLEIFHDIESILQERYSLLHSFDVHRADFLIRQHNISCIILYVDGHLDVSISRVNHIISLFPLLPVIGITRSNDLEAARICGKAGIDHVVAECDLNLLKDVVKKTIHEECPDFSWGEFGIDVEHCSVYVKQALRILKERYKKLKTVQEICEDLNITIVTLSHEFKKCCNVRPKRLLMILKINHAINLMANPGLSLKEIAGLVGFSNEKRFRENFKKLINIRPKEFRVEMINSKCFTYFREIVVSSKNKKRSF